MLFTMLQKNHKFFQLKIKDSYPTDSYGSFLPQHNATYLKSKFFHLFFILKTITLQ
jgi:hypothetical protein